MRAVSSGLGVQQNRWLCQQAVSIGLLVGRGRYRVHSMQKGIRLVCAGSDSCYLFLGAGAGPSSVAILLVVNAGLT